MLHGRGMSSTPAPNPVQTAKTGAVIRRLLRDYVSGHWGLLLFAILCMLLTSAVSGLVPLLLNLVVKLIFLRQQAEMLFSCSC